VPKELGDLLLDILLEEKKTPTSTTETKKKKPLAQDERKKRFLRSEQPKGANGRGDINN